MFNSMPDESKLWIYSFPRKLSKEEIKIVLNHLSAFVSNWISHGRPISGTFELAYDQFILLATNDDPSGCSIDSCIKALKELKVKYNLDALTHHLIFYKNHEGIQSVERANFKDIINQGEISEETLVFNNMITNVGELRSRQWLMPLKHSWHHEIYKKSA